MGSLPYGCWESPESPLIVVISGARLAEMMENPVGDDDTDINLYQQLHQLEVRTAPFPFVWFGGFQGGYVVGCFVGCN